MKSFKIGFVFFTGIKENNYTVGCDIHNNCIFMKGSFLTKFEKISNYTVLSLMEHSTMLLISSLSLY